MWTSYKKEMGRIFKSDISSVHHHGKAENWAGYRRFSYSLSHNKMIQKIYCVRAPGWCSQLSVPLVGSAQGLISGW